MLNRPMRLQRRFPTLTLEQIYATLTYYLHNKDKIDAYLADWIEFGEQMRAEQAKNPPAPMARLRQLDQQKILAEARAKYDAIRTMSSIKYLLDENVDPDLRAALKAKWPEMTVWHVGDPSTPSDQIT